MNKVLLALAAAVTICFTACAQKKDGQKQEAPQVLVVYFSATGTTAKVAADLAEVAGGKLCDIVPETAYTDADLDWNDKQSRSSVEMNDANSRPAIKAAKEDVGAYDVVFIGYPIWWNQAPRVVNTFIESHDLKGKALVPFATSGGSGIVNSVKKLRASYPGLDWKEGKLLNGSSKEDIRKWIEILGL